MKLFASVKALAGALLSCTLTAGKSLICCPGTTADCLRPTIALRRVQRLRFFSGRGLAAVEGALSHVKIYSHIACRAHAVPLPCRAAKSL